MKTGQTDALVTYVMAEVWPGVTSAKGFLGGEILRSLNGDAERLLLVTRWQDVESLENFLGPSWHAHQMTPVPAEEPHLAGAPFVDHWEQVEAVEAS